MSFLKPGLAFAASLMLFTSLSLAQPPGRRSPDDLVTQMMSFDADKDGKLSKAEVTDARLQGLFTKADADKDGFVTKAEWNTLFTQQAPSGGGRGPGDGRAGPGDGRAGPGDGRAGPGGPPKPGQILPEFMRDAS